MNCGVVGGLKRINPILYGKSGFNMRVFFTCELGFEQIKLAYRGTTVMN